MLTFTQNGSRVFQITLSFLPGVITDMKALEIAEFTQKLGAGRKLAADKIDHAVGIYLQRKVGEEVNKGEWPVDLCKVSACDVCPLRPANITGRRKEGIVDWAMITSMRGLEALCTFRQKHKKTLFTHVLLNFATIFLRPGGGCCLFATFYFSS